MEHLKQQHRALIKLLNLNKFTEEHKRGLLSFKVEVFTGHLDEYELTVINFISDA